MLNGSLINRQRLALGLMRHELAKASGVSWLILEMLEGSSWVDATHQLSTVWRVAHALGLKPADLPERDTEPCGAPQDAAIIGTVLAAHPQGLSDDVLARALDWSTARVRAALTTLSERLGAVGQTVRRVDGHNQLAPCANPLDPGRVRRSPARATHWTLTTLARSSASCAATTATVN